jgi:hypothetical protein
MEFLQALMKLLSFELRQKIPEKLYCYASLQTVLTVRHVPGNQNLIADLLGRLPILLGRHLCKESVLILGGSEVHLLKGWTSVTTTEDEAVV